MKYIITIAAALLASGQLYSQKPGNSGVISYEEKIKFEVHVQGGELPPMLDSLPNEQKSFKILYFNNDASLYEQNKAARAEKTDADQDNAMKFVVMEPENKVFSDFKTMQSIKQEEFMSRTFLISSDLKRFDWKLTGKQKSILGYPCQEAVSKDTSNKAVAWFCPMIPLPSGPDGYGNLPGIILELIMDNGDRTITANSVDIKDISSELLVKPKKGKKVTYEEYTAIRDEKIKEMGGTPGGKHQKMIMIRVAQ